MNIFNTKGILIMKKLFLIFVLFLVLTPSETNSQWNSKWKEVYATYDDESNGTGDQTVGVAVLKENTFIALVTRRNSLSFLVPYLNADSAKGRKMDYGYNPSTVGIFKKWGSGFDEVSMLNAWQVAIGPDSLIYVANNDENHNILVFALKDTIESVDYRTETGTNGIFSIHVDKNGFVYVLNDTSLNKTNDLKIYPPKNQWSADRKTNPIRTIDLPDGIYKGVVTSNNGKVLFISNYQNRNVYRYDGSPTTGYVKTNTFQFNTLKDTVLQISNIDTASVLGLGFNDSKGLLFVASSKLFGGSSWYKYGRIYMLSAKTGAVLDTIDQAKWNFTLTGGYNLRSGGITPGNVSGYASSYDVDVDEKGNLYLQSFYGWTVEKWIYDGTLPSITKIEKVESAIPIDFQLYQNYPNPFNPKTTIRFSLLNDSKINISIKNILGQIIFTPVNEMVSQGVHEVKIDMNQFPSGTYYYTISNRSESLTKTMMLIK